MDSLAVPLRTIKKENPTVTEREKEIFPIKEIPKEDSLNEDDWNNEDVEEIDLDGDTSTIFSSERQATESKSQGIQIFNEYELHKDKNRKKDRDESSERGSDGETTFSLPEFAPVAQAISMKWSENDIITHISNEKAKQKQFDTKTNLQIDAKKKLKSNSKSENSGIVSNFDSDSDNFSDNNGNTSDFNDESKDEKKAMNIEGNSTVDVKITKLSQFLKNNSNNSSTNNSDTENHPHVIQNTSTHKPSSIVLNKTESKYEIQKVTAIIIEEDREIITASSTKSAYSNFLRANSAGKCLSSNQVNDENASSIPIENRFSNFITNNERGRDSGTDTDTDSDRDRNRGSDKAGGREKARLEENMGIAGKGKIPKDYQRQSQEDFNFFDHPVTTSSNAPLSSKIPLNSMSTMGSGNGNQSTQNRSLPKGPKSPQHSENISSSSSNLSFDLMSKSTKLKNNNDIEKNDVKSEGKVEDWKEWKGEQRQELEDDDLCESSFDELNFFEDPIDTSASVVLDFNSISLSPI